MIVQKLKRVSSADHNALLITAETPEDEAMLVLVLQELTREQAAGWNGTRVAQPTRHGSESADNTEPFRCEGGSRRG